MVIIYDINRLRLGLKIIQDGEPCVIVNSEFVKPGKCQSFNRVKFRNLISGKVLEKTFKSGDSIELADVKELDLTYLYNDGFYWYFMNLKNFEQTFISFQVVKDHIKWLVEQSLYTVIFWNDNPVFLVPPRFIELKVINIQAVIRGDSTVRSTKLAMLSTGVVIRVPLFIQEEEWIKVDTHSSKYISRVK